MEAEESFPSLLKGGIFSKAVRSCSSCCLSSFHCKSNLPTYGSLQEASTRVKREISSHGDFQALWQIGVELLGINYRKRTHISSYSLSEDHMSPNRERSLWVAKRASLWEPRRSQHWRRIPALNALVFSCLVTAVWVCVEMEDSSKLTLLISNKASTKGSQTGTSSLTSAEEYKMRQMHCKVLKDWSELLRTTLGQGSWTND